MPNKWVDLNMDEAKREASMQQLAKDNPHLKPILDQVKKMPQNINIRLLVFNLEDRSQGFSENIHVVDEQIGHNITLDQAMEANLNQMKMMLPDSKFEVDKVKLEAGDARRLRHVLPMNAPDGSKLNVFLEQYFLVRGESILTFTFSTLEKNKDKRLPLFKEMIESARVSRS